MTKKIVVPDGMLRAAEYGSHGFVVGDTRVKSILEAALIWLSENPIMPTIDQQFSLHIAWCRSEDYKDKSPHPIQDQILFSVVDWQRVMFLAPEPEIPEEVKDLLAQPWGFKGNYDGNIIEAFRRGQKVAKR